MQLASIFQKSCFATKGFKTVKSEIVNSREELQNWLKEGNIDVGIVIPNKWGKQSSKEESQEPKVLIGRSDKQADLCRGIHDLLLSRTCTNHFSTAKTVITDLAKSQQSVYTMLIQKKLQRSTDH